MQRQKIKAANLILSDGDFKKELDRVAMRFAYRGFPIFWIFPDYPKKQFLTVAV